MMQTVLLRRIIVLIAVTLFGSLSACQRAPYAYFAPTHHPTYERLAANKPAPSPTADSLLTASLNEDIPVSTKPVWEKAVEPASEPTVVSKLYRPTFWYQAKRALRKKSAAPQCDQIVLRNGDVIEAKIKEVGVNEIKYKKCDRPDGPDYTISKRDVLSIRYPNGDVERFGTAAAPSQPQSNPGRSTSAPPANEGPRTDPFAIVAICAGAVGVLFGGILLGPAAIVFGAISLSRIRRNPERFKGKGLAVGGLVAGIVAAAAYFLFYYGVVVI